MVHKILTKIQKNEKMYSLIKAYGTVVTQMYTYNLN